MAKKKVAQRFVEALRPRTPEQAKRAPQQRSTIEFMRGQQQAGAAGAGAGAAAGALGTYLATRGDDAEEERARMRSALATAPSGRADDALEQGYPSVTQRRQAMGAYMAEGLPESGEVESGAAAGGRTMRKSAGPYDNMSFNAAFKAARGDDRATFTWRGNTYTTEMAQPKGEPSKAAVPSKRGTQYDDEEPVKLRAGGGVRMSRAGKMPALSKMAAPKAGPMAKGMPAKMAKPAALKIARFAKGGEVRGAGVAKYGMRACKKS